jgi:signal transduction histidine kinase
MTARTASRLAWGMLVATTVLSIGSVVLIVLTWDAPRPPSEFGPRGFSAGVALVFGTVGAVVASRRPSNPIGWIFCVIGLGAGVQALGTEYALWALIEEEGRPPLGTWGAWLGEWLWIPYVGGIGLVAAIFPDGRFLSRRWRTVIAIGIVGAVFAMVGNALVEDLTIYSGYDSPLPFAFLSADAAGIAVLPLMILMVGGAASAVARFRRSRGDERQQLKWLALSVVLMVVALASYALAVGLTGQEVNAEGSDWAENLMVLSFFAVPISVGIGVLKYRLYDVDLVISKALVYGALAVFITLVYVGIVVGVGAAVGSQGNALLSAIAAAVVALAFQPARRYAQHLANRLVYGKRATPYEVLSKLSSRFAGTYSLEDALPRLARVTAEAVGADRTRIWLRDGGTLRPAAAWPAIDPAEPIALAGDDLTDLRSHGSGIAVRHQGELLGAISIGMPASEPLSPAQDKLLRDVADQAGLVLRNVALLEDLRTSRRRLVAAQDEERRRLERNIHDGAQQQLVALSVKLRLLEQLVTRDTERATSAAADLQIDVTDALENLRDLARGIYPPLLADKGLAAALESQARKSSVPVAVEQDGIGRYPQDVEAAVYFCTLEALQNVAKYAGASSARVVLGEAEGRLTFAVIDDGAGFDPETAGRGAGLTNMRDRVEALGGRLEIRSAPGAGTTVAGTIPTGGGTT